MSYVLIFSVSCKKDELTGNRSVLIGKWGWDYSIQINRDGIPPVVTSIDTIRPAWDGVNYTFEFLTEGKLLVYKNEKLIEEFRTVFVNEGISDSLGWEYHFDIKINNLNPSLDGKPIYGGYRIEYRSGNLMINDFPYSNRRNGASVGWDDGINSGYYLSRELKNYYIKL